MSVGPFNAREIGLTISMLGIERTYVTGNSIGKIYVKAKSITHTIGNKYRFFIFKSSSPDKVIFAEHREFVFYYLNTTADLF